MNFKKLNQAAKHFRTSSWFQLNRALRLKTRSHFTLSEIMEWGLTDPAISSAEIDNYMSAAAVYRLMFRVNARQHARDVDDKTRAHAILRQAGLAVPEVFGVIRAGSSDAGDRKLVYHLPDVDWSRVPDGPLVAKPIWGFEGRGVSFLDKQGDRLALNGERHHTGDIQGVLRRTVASDGILRAFIRYTGGRTDDFLLQSRLKPHPTLARLSHSPGLQCVRIVTFIDSSGRVQIPVARCKILRKGNLVDNYHRGIGNLLATVDLETGRLQKAYHKIDGRIGLELATVHPDSGAPLEGVTIPFWPEVKALAHKGALSFKELRTIGWDIAITAEGPILLEAGQEWAPFPIAPVETRGFEEEWRALVRTPLSKQEQAKLSKITAPLREAPQR